MWLRSSGLGACPHWNSTALPIPFSAAQAPNYSLQQLILQCVARKEAAEKVARAGVGVSGMWSSTDYASALGASTDPLAGGASAGLVAGMEGDGHDHDHALDQ